MDYLNYIVEDRLTGLHYAFSIVDGILQWDITTENARIDPTVIDVFDGNYYRILIFNGITGQEPSLDAVTGFILYDTGLNVYWNIYFTNGILSQELTAPPVAKKSKGFQHLEHYYRFLANSKNIEISFTATGNRKFKVYSPVGAYGKKVLRIAGNHKLVGQKKAVKKDVIESKGYKHFSGLSGDLNGNGFKTINADAVLEGKGVKVFNVKEHSLSANGYRNIIPLLESVGIL